MREVIFMLSIEEIRDKIFPVCEKYAISEACLSGAYRLTLRKQCLSGRLYKARHLTQHDGIRTGKGERDLIGVSLRYMGRGEHPFTKRSVRQNRRTPLLVIHARRRRFSRSANTFSRNPRISFPPARAARRFQGGSSAARSRRFSPN